MKNSALTTSGKKPDEGDQLVRFMAILLVGRFFNYLWNTEFVPTVKELGVV